MFLMPDLLDHNIIYTLDNNNTKLQHHPYTGIPEFLDHKKTGGLQDFSQGGQGGGN